MIKKDKKSSKGEETRRIAGTNRINGKIRGKSVVRRGEGGRKKFRRKTIEGRKEY
jgi:hypothetical protein